jgi:hypothetical protein
MIYDVKSNIYQWFTYDCQSQKATIGKAGYLSQGMKIKAAVVRHNHRSRAGIFYSLE